MKDKKSSVMYIRIREDAKARIQRLAATERRRYTDMVCVLLDEAIERREKHVVNSIPQ